MSATNVYANTPAILALLRENDNRLKYAGLQSLAANINHLWHEVANHIRDIEILYEDEKFPHRELVASICSKMYYHLEDYDESLNYALNAGQFFDINLRDQYTKCLLTRCIDKYSEDKRKRYDQAEADEVAAPGHEAFIKKLEPIVDKLVELSIADGEHKYALGIGIETRNLAKIHQILGAPNANVKELLHYIYRLCEKTVLNKKFRLELLTAVVKGIQAAGNWQHNDYVVLSECFVLLNTPEELAKILVNLISSGNAKEHLLAYQIAFDVSDNENKGYNSRVVAGLQVGEKTDELKQRFERLIRVLNGDSAQEISMAFLKVHNQSDPQIIKDLKTGIDQKNSIAHHAVILANAFMQAGTQNDAFITENTDWIGKATHWARFSATASLGVIYQGNYTEGKQKLQPYFFGAAPNPNFPMHGGALYGLGLIFAGTKNEEVIEQLKAAIKDQNHNSSEPIIHGACLGLGLVGLASGDAALCEELKNVLFTDNAVTGEAAAVGIGLVMVGVADDEIVGELIQYAHETQHEKIIRSIALAMAMMSYRREQNADTLIEQLSRDKDQLLRYGAMMATGMAYVGTANQQALKRLLHHAVSDVSDAVRKAAVIALGFLLCKDFEQIPKVLSLLAVSFNPHVRYGAALAIGIACAGTVYAEALNILEPLLTDSVDFVRQAAYIGMAMVLQQATEGNDPRVAKLRQTIKEVATKKHEDNLCRLGAIMSHGIIEAGGRNAIISMISQSGNLKLSSCVGVLLFSHFWYWFPFIHFLSLSFTPSALIGVNKDLQVPRGFAFKSNAKPSLFDYPPKIKVADKKEQEKAKTVTLSTTNRVKARAAKKGGAGGEMEAEKDPKESPAQTQGMEEEKKEEKKEEPNYQILVNPYRVLEKQVRYITYIDENRYKPLIPERKKGILLLSDSTPDAPDDVLDFQGAPASSDDVKPPEPFVFDEAAHKASLAAAANK